MAVPAETVQTFAMFGIREDLSDVISNIAPTETPFYSMCKKGTAKNRSPEWQTDTLADADATNAAIEGDDVAADAVVATVRLKNYTQIMDKTVSVSTTGQAVDTAGRANELKYQVAKNGQELKRDIEARAVGNYASLAGDASTASTMAGAEAWITTNQGTVEAGGTAGGWDGAGIVDAQVNATATIDATEAQLKDVIRLCWAEGGDPTVILVNGEIKQAYSEFTGIATQYRDNPGRSTAKASILAAADVYISDFGTHSIMPDRFMSTRSALVLDPKLWELKFLQPFKTVPLAKTGHNDKRLMSVELTLCSKNELGNGKVVDINAA